MSTERKQRLDDLDFVWDPLAEAWEEGFNKLFQFKEANGHCIVKRSLELGGFKLGSWIHLQRSSVRRMPPERKQRLDDLGFVWDVLEAFWEEAFSKLLQFKEAEGHCRVAQKVKLDGFYLGKWVSHQRTAKDSMSPERRQRLDDVGFIWDVSKDKPNDQ